MKYQIVAEVRENHSNYVKSHSVYNDYVSKQSMLDLCEAINHIGYECDFLGGMEELFSVYKNRTNISDIIFINYNYGLPANYKRVQSPALLELMHAKYSGADPLTALLVNDKDCSKKILKSAGINVPLSIRAIKNNLQQKLSKINLPLSVVIKPNCEGSSLGISKDCLCSDYTQVFAISNRLLQTYDDILIEQYIEGYECTVWLIGNPDDFRLVAPLLISEKGNFYFKNRIFTMYDKANRIRDYSLPETVIGAKLSHELCEISKFIFKELGLRDYARIDFRIFDNKIFFIEANALPIFSKTSEIGKITNLYSISYENICRNLIKTINNRLMTKTD